MMFSWTRLEPIPQHGLLRTVGDCEWNGPDYKVLIPTGFYFDGASVPKWGWPLLQDADPIKLLPAGLVHDYCVRRGAELLMRAPGVHHYSRTFIRDADHAIAIMDDVMRWSGIPAQDRVKVRLALDATDRFYWQKKDMAWTGTYNPS